MKFAKESNKQLIRLNSNSYESKKSMGYDEMKIDNKFKLEHMKKNNLTQMLPDIIKPKSSQNFKSKDSRSSEDSLPFSISRALKNKEILENNNNNLLNEIASKLNKFRATILSKNSETDSNEDEEGNEEQEEEKKKEVKLKELNKNINERVFWTKDKMERIKQKLKTAIVKINEKTDNDFKELLFYIENGNKEEITNILLDINFKSFYGKEIEKFQVLIKILRAGYPDILVEIMKDKFYKFDKRYVFTFILEILNQNSENGFYRDSYENTFKNIIDFDLYESNHVRIIIWFIGFFGFEKVFLTLATKHEEFNSYMHYYRDFDCIESIQDFVNNLEVISISLVLCLEYNFEELAIVIIQFNDDIDKSCDSPFYKAAIKYNCFKVLQYVWESYCKPLLNKTKGKVSAISSNTSFKSSKLLDKKKNFSISNAIIYHKNKKKSKNFKVSDLINYYSKRNNKNAISEIMKWKYLELDKELLTTLFNHNCFDDVYNLIWKNKYFNLSFTKEQFKIVINDGEQLDLILYFLKIRDCRVVLDEIDVQKSIVKNYMKTGKKIYYGAEMLVAIYKNSWQQNLTKELCKNIEKILKTKEILNCHSPILTSLLICEFLTSIGEISVQHNSICLKLVSNLGQFCKSIQEANPDEKYIRFLMTQKDIRSRNAFQIASDNNFYSVLESPEIGTIVKKMWNGRLSYDSFYEYSTLFRYLDQNTNLRSINPYENFERFDTKKVFIFQLNLWTESCSLRYWPESISTIFLIVLYNLYIYFLVNKGLIMKPLNEVEDGLRVMLYIYIIWTVAINLNIINIIIFSKLSKRKFRLDNWSYVEILMMIFAFTLLIDTNKLFIANYQNSDDDQNEFAFIIRAVILSINDLFVWFRLTGILLTFKEFGPLIRMIYLLCLTTVKYLVLYLLYMTCCAAIFTAIFYKASPNQYNSFSQTFATLFNGFMNNLSVFDFEYYKTFGAIMQVLYVTMSGVLLMNLLIALLDGIYNQFEKYVDALNTSVLITYFRRYKWDQYYGYLLFLPTPINIVNFIVLPITLLLSRKKKDDSNKTISTYSNILVCKIYFAIFYIPIILLGQIIGELIVLPICYIKGIINIIRYQFTSREYIMKRIYEIIIWIMFGIPYLFYIFIRDKVDVIMNIYRELQIGSYEKNRIKNYIKPIEVRIFLEFIHGRGKEKSNDLQTLFQDYIKFDIDKKAEDDASIKEKANYLEKLHGVTDKKTKPNHHSSILLYNIKRKPTQSEIKEKDIKKPNNEFDISRICKRNLIIIEIMENFLIEDGSDNLIVDIDKLTNLLPKTTIIDNAYMKRLVYTDINSLNKALNKLKSKTKQNNIVRYKLMEKAVKGSTLLDALMDNEAKKQKLSCIELPSNNDIKDEDDNNKENDIYRELSDLLNNVSMNIKETLEQHSISLDGRSFNSGSKSSKRKNSLTHYNN